MDIDRISDMPDSVLCHILSFISTDEAVTTSILYRRWRNVWKHLRDFDFTDSSFEEDNKPTSFVPFVNSVLARRRTRDFVYFRVASTRGFATVDDIASWIHDVPGPHLEEFHLMISTDGNLSLPPSIFTCRGLVSLCLNGSICVEGLQSVYLPSLKTLDLDIDYIDSSDIFLSFSWCPVLETLEISFKRANAAKIRVPSSLKSLTFSVTEAEAKIEDIDIDCPSLEYLDITLGSPTLSRFSVTNLQNVVEARLYFNRQVETHFDFVIKLLKAFIRIKVMYLDISTVKLLLYAPNLHFPEFSLLLRLNLDHPRAVNPDFLLKLLHKCCMLQFLSVQVFANHQWEEPWSLESWTQPINDPNCLRSQLITFECRGYQGYANEEAFIAYFLQRGLLLKTVTIVTNHRLDLGRKYHIIKKLAVIPRASNMCQLHFD